MTVVRWLFVVLVIFAVPTVAFPEPAGAFPPPGLARDADAYRAGLVAERPPQPQPERIAAARQDLSEAIAAERADDVVQGLERLVGLVGAADEGPVWQALGEAWMTVTPPNPPRALQALWLAAARASSLADRHAILWRMADLFETPLAQPNLALQALEAIQAGDADHAGLTERMAALRRIVGLEVRNVRVDPERDDPQVCIELSNRVRDEPGRRYEDFIAVTPALDEVLAEPADETLCLSGFAHGSTYTVTLRQGLPAEAGVALRRDAVHRVTIGDRAPRVAFRGDAFILPRQGPLGVPLSTVNLDAVEISLFRINDRNIVPQLVADRMFRALDPGAARRTADTHGERIWQGEMAVERRRNETVVTAIPVDAMLEEAAATAPGLADLPGLYVLTARARGVPEGTQPWTLATRWLMISDLGLTVVRGADGLQMFVRSLATAKPLAGVRATLLARNNTTLGSGLSDADGRVTFGTTIARGEGGRAPAAILAYGEGGDFAVLDLGRPAFDLTDRGVGGRPVPGPLDAFVYADRGVFRPGETAHVTVLLRDDQSVAVERFPLTLRVLRPNGTVFQEGVSTEAAPGLHVLRLPLTRTAPLGTWSVLALADPEAAPIGRLTLQVEEFVPERLAVEVEGSAPAIVPTEPFDLTVRSRFLYGPPAAGLDGSARVLVGRDADPYPMHPGFRFGLAQDDVAALSRSLPFAASDAAGVTRVPVRLPPLPDTTVALQATFDVAVQEPGGRPTRQSLTVPVRQQPFALGLRPLFDGDRVAEDGDPAFALIAVDGAGALIDRAGLTLELFEERWTYQWFVRGGSQDYRTSIRSRSLDRVTVAATAAGPLRHTFAPLPYGRYRLEVGDAATGVATSVRFSVGWQVSAVASDSPDKLDLAADRPAYRPGETARLRITPPFAGEALVTVATDRVLATTTLAVPAEGATVALPVTADWGVGAYVTATVYRPPLADRDYLPVRALGLAWLPIDPAERTLTVTLPELVTVRPRQRLEIPVRVTDAGGAPATEAHVTLAAVDEGILQLTRFVAPDPAAHYLGKRRLGVDIRDDYSRLIAARSGPLGALRQGGDQSLGASLADVPLTIVSLFQGPVAVGADGIARISLEIPDFNGELRLMAVAADGHRVGAAARPLAVRDPLVAELVLPRFLAPGDESRATVALHNVEAAAGVYHLEVSGAGAVAVEDGASDVRLARGARATVFAPLIGTEPGRGNVRLSVRGPDGFAVQRELALTVRSARPVVATSEMRQLAPGAVARFGADRFAPYLEGTAAIRLTFATQPPIDVAGLLAALDRYPHGCLEQVVSQALPLLVAGDLARVIGAAEGIDGGDLAAAGRIERAIGLVLDMQRYDGAFGVWSGYDAEAPWLTAYALEFLTRARQAGHTVPAAPYTAGLAWLRAHAVDGGRSDEELASRAYALHVLALAEVATPGVLRYFVDAFADRLPTPLARGQLAAALLRFGDDGRATDLIESAVGRLARDFWTADYGSTTRDAAALLVLLADVDRLDGRQLESLMDRLPSGRLLVEKTNTQEKAWIIMAADALSADARSADAQSGGAAAPEVRVTGTSPVVLGPAGGIVLAPTASEIVAGIQVANAGVDALWHAVALSGVSAAPLPAAAAGLRLRRSFHARKGEDLDLDGLQPGDVFVLVLRGEATTGITHQAVLTQALPAGWEIENARLGDAEAESMPWLGALTPPRAVEARDDRYVAAIDLTREASEFRIALLVRVVTPGTYELPGAVLEDMYRPRIFARQGMGRITITPAD